MAHARLVHLRHSTRRSAADADVPLLRGCGNGGERDERKDQVVGEDANARGDAAALQVGQCGVGTELLEEIDGHWEVLKKNLYENGAVREVCVCNEDVALEFGDV